MIYILWLLAANFRNQDLRLLKRQKSEILMDPEEVEFLGEKQLVTIIPSFTSEPIHLISGDFGPFRAGLPVKVPLWVAVNLKQQKRCKIQPPAWMDVETLEAIKNEEKLSRFQFVSLVISCVIVILGLLQKCLVIFTWSK